MTDKQHDMTREEFQRVGRQMIADARKRFRQEAFALCRTDAEREKVVRLETAIGEVSPEEAVLAFRRWLDEEAQPAAVGAEPRGPEEREELDQLVAEYKHISDNDGEHRIKDLVWLINELIYERDHRDGKVVMPRPDKADLIEGMLSEQRLKAASPSPLRPEEAHKPTCRSWRCGWEWRTENGAGVCRQPRDSEIHYVGTVDSHAFVQQPCDCKAASRGPDPAPAPRQEP